MNENLASIHAYLCADGYVVTNPETQKHKYYRVGLRNTNETLLKDFQDKFEKEFHTIPRIVPKQRCEIGSKEIYELLTKEFGSFYSWEWKMPELQDKLTKVWLKAYFDCEGWVFCKSHQNRHIGVDCVNKRGIEQVEKSLNNLGISTIKKYNNKRKVYRLIIYGKENISAFKEKINFLHPEKKEKLNKAIKDFIEYKWNTNESLKNFIEKAKIKTPNGIIRVISKLQENLNAIQENLLKEHHINSKINKRKNGNGKEYFELSINKKEEVKYLIEHNLIKESEREKWQKLKK